jgi:hypothetical protein
LTKRRERPTNAGAAGASGARSRTKTRGPQSQVKQTRDIIDAPRSEEQRAASRLISGCDDHDFTLNLVHQAVAALGQQILSSDERQVDAILAAMCELKPRDPFEGMVIAQAIACHNAAMECYRLAMINEQTFQGWRESLNQANRPRAPTRL